MKWFTKPNRAMQNNLSFKIIIAPILVFLLLVFNDRVEAQEVETLDTLVVFKEVVVSSMRVPQTAAGSGRNITMIPARKIESMPAQTTDDVLRYVSGIEVQSRGAFGTQSDFSLRGSTFSQVLVLVDGMRINDPLTAHFNSYIPVAPSEIQRIEILHGPASAQYGADAVGGAINIITKTFGNQDSRDQTNAYLKGGYGQDDLKLGRGGFNYSSNRYRFSGGGMWHQSPGQQLAEDYKNRFNIGNASLSAGVKLNEQWDLALRSGYDHRDFNARYFYTSSPVDDATEKVSAWWNQMRLQKSSENSTTTLKGAFKRNFDSYVFNPETPANEHTTTMASLQLNQYRDLSPQWDWTYGLHFNNRAIQSTDRGDHNTWHYAGYTMLQWQPNDPFTVSGNFRLDNDENYGTELMPQLSMSYQRNQWIVRASGGRSVRAPSFTERFISTNLAGPLTEGRNIGNPALRAERSWSGELGVDLFPVSGLRLSATGFVRESSNLIDYVLTNSDQIHNNDNLQSGTNYLYAHNISSVETAGIETELSAGSSLGNGWVLNGTVGYTFTDFFGSEEEVSKYLSNYARHLVNGGITLRKGRFEGSLTGLWKQRQADRVESIDAFKTSSYNIWDMKISYDIVDRISLGLQVDNLFDVEYQDILGAQMPQRWVLSTLTWEFNSTASK